MVSRYNRNKFCIYVVHSFITLDIFSVVYIYYIYVRDYKEFKTSHFTYLYIIYHPHNIYIYICNINIILDLRILFYTKYLHYCLIIEKKDMRLIHIYSIGNANRFFPMNVNKSEIK